MAQFVTSPFTLPGKRPQTLPRSVSRRDRPLEEVAVLEDRRAVLIYPLENSQLGFEVLLVSTLRLTTFQAAERRIRDELVCGSGKTAVREGRKAPKSGVRILGDVIDLTLEDPNSPRPGPSSSKKRGNSFILDAATGGSGAQAGKWTNGAPPALQETPWECTICTLFNEPMALACDACGVEKPTQITKRWGCLYCGEQEMDHSLWTCRFCGQMKVES